MTSVTARIATASALAAGTIALGMLPAVAPLVVDLALGACIFLVFLILALRRALPRAAGVDRRTSEDTKLDPRTFRNAGPRGDRDDLRVARLLFYAGTLLVGQLAFRYVAGLTIGESMFIAAFFVCAFSALRGHPIAGVPAPVLVAVAVFVLGGMISSLDAQSQTHSAFQVLHATWVLLLWPIVGAMVLRTKRQVTIAIALWSLSAAIDGAGAVAQLFGFHLLNIAQEGSRMTGFTDHPNDLGAVTAIALVPSLLIATRSTPASTRGSRICWWLLPALIAVGLMLSGSVSAMAGGALAVLVWLASPPVRRSSRVALTAAVICALGVVAVAGGRVSSPVHRLTQVANPSSQTGGSVQDRLSIAAQAWPRIARDPFLGVGLDTADSGVTIITHGYTTPNQIHGLPLAAWYQAGVFGTLGVMSLLVALAGLGWTGVARGETEDELLIGIALLAAFIAFVVVAMTQPMGFQQDEWIAAAFVLIWNLRRAVSSRLGSLAQASDGSRSPPSVQPAS